MREIKFRGKRLDNGEWVYGSLIIDDVSGKYFIVLSVTESEKTGQEGCLYCVTYEVDPASVGQYTGRKDIHGREIYEGDVVSWRDSDKNTRINYVKFGHCKFYLCNYNFSLDEYPHIKIIGNIYEHSDLLKDGAK